MKKVITYFSDLGGMPEPSSFLSDRAIFKEAYIFIPRGCIRDIVVSVLPNWDKTRCWVLAKPLTGFIETFSYYLMELLYQFNHNYCSPPTLLPVPIFND